MKILVVAAHPDDEILGVGGTLLRHASKGDEVFVCIVTKAFEPQWSKEYMETKIKEQAEVDKLVGIKKRYNLDLMTTKLNTIPHGELNKKITGVVDEVNPDVIYTHFENDLNYDHTIIFRACLVATRPPKRIKLLSYETVSETEWNNKPFLPNVWNEIKDQIDNKVKAFEIYKSEVKKWPHPRSGEGIRVLAKKRGSEICVEYAEAFMLIKDIQN
ncbi:MAG: PIG-L deacetylase family protein [Candidatus Margulisiibacteriota bacterium]|nr:PIG-L deacetylase family protein [Candidatus Margulisiibacteriota bacterium]